VSIDLEIELVFLGFPLKVLPVVDVASVLLTAGNPCREIWRLKM